jgi:hypothetical protein
MSLEVVSLVASVASVVVSALSLLVTITMNRQLDDEGHAAFAVVGADEGNHEARLERLETKAGLTVIPSPSALDAIPIDLGDDAPVIDFEEGFEDGREDAELRIEDHAQDAMTNEGGRVDVHIDDMAQYEEGVNRE